MGTVPMRISRISENLQVIQNEIALLTGQELEANLSDNPFAEPDVTALRKVKSSVDHLRQVLRAYIEFASTHMAADSAEFQAARTERTMQILRHACAGLEMRERQGHGVPVSLFEQLTQLAIAAVDRHQAKAPVVLPTAAD